MLVSGGTLALLTLPGIAMTRDAALSRCPYAQHTHDESCLDENGQYVCGYAVAHLHDELCYAADGTLICPLPEIEPHTHDESCYESVQSLICGLEEGADGHVHDDSCYAETQVLACTLQELPVHVHTEECFALPEDTQPETEPETEAASEEELPESDPTADVETAEIWEQPLADLTLTGDWNEDLLTVAKTQLGYRESERNFELVDGEIKGYTRYGAWYGAPYGDWCAMFLSFCLHYADIPAAAMPREASCNRWIELLTEKELYHAVPERAEGEPETAEAEDVPETAAEDVAETAAEEAYLPKTGDLVFFRMQEPTGSDHVGVVCELDEEQGILSTIEGNSDNRVQRLFYALDDERIVGYGELPEEPTYTLEQTCLAGGHRYTVTVRYGDAAGVPQGASLSVAEIPATDRQYDDYVAMSESALGLSGGSAAHVLLLDIKLIDGAGQKIEIAAPVDVTITAETDGEAALSADSQLVHIPDDAEVGEVVDSAEITGDSVSFTADGFSAYAIVTGPDAVQTSVETVAHTSEIQDGTAYYLSYNDAAMYVTNALNTNSAFVETNTSGGASSWFLEPTGGTDEFYLYTYVEGNKRYVKNTSGNLVGLVASGGTALTLSESGANDNTFYFKITNQNKWLQHSNGGKGFRFWTDNNNATNSCISITKASSYSLPTDPYKLDGKTYGLMHYTNGLTGKALMANMLPTGDALEAVSMTVLANENDRDDTIFTPKNSGITRWTFHSLHEDYYTLTAQVDGETKYLKIDEHGVYLSDDPCEIQVIAGATGHEGEICLRGGGGGTLTYTGSIASGFSWGGTVGSEWLHLVDETVLTPDYYMVHAADKVSISDRDRVPDGSKVVVYTRVWNTDKKRYDFYAIDHDGTLFPVYESGDEIQWFGSRLNTLLWDFTEYHWEGTNDPNYYYELYNEFSQKYLAPQVVGGQILSDETIGINLNGRRNGYYYSNILAWDDANYAYAGLRAHVGSTASDRYIESCQINQTSDFYFALVHDLPSDDHLTPVPTIDNNQHGITMKMVNFDTPRPRPDGTSDVPTSQEQYDLLGESIGGAVKTTRPDLLSNHLDADGYPVATKTGALFKDVFESAPVVNHLFLESTYEGSGYFEFDSTQNFATLRDGPNVTNQFTVFQELATTDGRTTNTMKHGQFLPYDDIEPGNFAVTNGRNLYNALAEELPDGDPRKNERLYKIESADYYFGMELTASFEQTPNGHDAWGHDIIYEFTGDDDFWLYVDGELVIDLGGIHSALAGTVNYCTGEVMVNGTRTTLYDTFRSNYIKRYKAAHNDEEPSQAELDAYLIGTAANNYEDGIFEDDGSAQHRMIFKDYTTHEMKIYYMERGGGASNLHMRFNLASVKPGTVLLSKELGNVSELESIEAEFPYQIWYQKEDGTTVQDLLLTNESSNIYVYYKDTITPVRFEASHTVGGITYPSVFLLSPGQTAEIRFPDDTISYRIVECGVDKKIYESVTVDTSRENEVLTETEVPAPGGGRSRYDYALDYVQISERPRVVYTNNVDQNALRNLTIRKRLYAEDGVTEIHHDDPIFGVDSAIFGFRLYFRTENAEVTATSDGFEPANMYAYHVKDNNGNYCYWDGSRQIFVSLGETVYGNLSENDKVRATFHTSMNGSISKIPVDYDVEIREILAGTEFRVVERDSEIPDGYSRRDYTLKYGDTDPGVTTQTAAEGVMPSGETEPDPHVDVNNLRGWGLRVNKVWADADFMASRDPIYVAVFLGDSPTPYAIETEEDDGLGGTVVTSTSTVRKLEDGVTTMYWYLPKLASGTTFNQYHVREVVLTNPVASGETFTYDAIDRIDDGEQMTVNGVQAGFTTGASFTYTAANTQGTLPQGSNVRVDTVTNSRPGVTLRKLDWDGNPLAGAQFTLQLGDAVMGPFTSDASGLVGTVYLGENADYTLNETRAPQGYYGIESPLTLRLSVSGSTGTLTVTPAANAPADIGDYYVLNQSGAGGMPELSVKNRNYTLRFDKQDGESFEPLSGVTFTLHREVTVNGITDIDFTPLSGYEAMVTDASGVIPGLDETLPSGTYYLEETVAPAGYIRMTGYLRFTVGPKGAVEILSEGRENWLTKRVEGDTVIYTLAVPNVRARTQITLQKVGYDNRNPSLGDYPVTGAVFSIYESDGTTPLTLNGVAQQNLTDSGDGIFFSGGLAPGTYYVEEVLAPSGYAKLPGRLRLTVSSSGATLYGTWVSGDPAHSVGTVTGDNRTGFTMTVRNSAGYALPSTGAIGRTPLYVLGAILTLLSATALLPTRKRRPR